MDGFFGQVTDTFDLVLTDPPYLVSYAGRWGSDYEPIEGDSDSTWVVPVYSEIHRVLKADALCLTFFGWPHAETFLSTWRQVGLRPVSVFVLVKGRIGLGYYTRAQHEQAYLLAKGKPKKPSRPSVTSSTGSWPLPSFTQTKSHFRQSPSF